MHPSSALNLGAAMTIFVHTAQAALFAPYKDGQCKEPVDNFTTNGNVVDLGDLEGFPNARYWDNVGFGGAESNISGFDVWWKIEEPDNNCGVALMQEYSQGFWGDLPFDQPPGNVVMMAKKAGCVFSHIPLNTNIMGSFCCGSGDCTALSVGNSALAKRDLSIAELSKPTTRSKRSARKQARDGEFDASGCKTIIAGESNPSAGQQQLVVNTQTCTALPCTFAVASGVTVSTSFSSSQSTTITNQVGGSISVQSGIDFIIKADVTAEINYSWAQAVAKETSTSITNSTTITVTNTMGQLLGSTAFLTFTPTYTCWPVTVDCGTPDKGSYNYCQPSMTSDGKGLQGEYMVVYTN